MTDQARVVQLEHQVEVLQKKMVSTLRQAEREVEELRKKVDHLQEEVEAVKARIEEHKRSRR